MPRKPGEPKVQVLIRLSRLAYEKIQAKAESKDPPETVPGYLSRNIENSVSESP